MLRMLILPNSSLESISNRYEIRINEFSESELKSDMSSDEVNSNN
jgi:hypothetical protein